MVLRNGTEILLFRLLLNNLELFIIIIRVYYTWVHWYKISLAPYSNRKDFWDEMSRNCLQHIILRYIFVPDIMPAYQNVTMKARTKTKMWWLKYYTHFQAKIFFAVYILSQSMFPLSWAWTVQLYEPWLDRLTYIALAIWAMNEKIE